MSFNKARRQWHYNYVSISKKIVDALGRAIIQCLWLIEKWMDALDFVLVMMWAMGMNLQLELIAFDLYA